MRCTGALNHEQFQGAIHVAEHQQYPVEDRGFPRRTDYVRDDARPRRHDGRRAYHPKELGLSIVEMSMILTVYFWAYAIGQMPAGRLAERIGSRKVLFGTSTLWSLMMIVTPFGATFAWLFGCRLVLGGAQSETGRAA